MMLRAILAAGCLFIGCRSHEPDSATVRPMSLAAHDAGEGMYAFQIVNLGWKRCRNQDEPRCWLKLARACADRAEVSPIFVDCAKRSYIEFLRVSPDAGGVGSQMDDTNLFRATP